MKRNKKIVIAIAIIALIAIATVVALKTSHKSAQSAQAPSVAGTKVSTNQSTNTSSSPSNSNTPSTASTKQAAPSGSVSGTLLSPTGSFVSNHHPNLSGHPAPNQEQSVCNTTPSAMCDIEFSMNGVTKSLGSKVADSGGAVYWTWTLQNIGLTQGSWKITAKATLNDQTKSTTDSLNLEVQP